MESLEELPRLLSAYPQLSFVEPFLRAHKMASLFLVGGALRDLLLRRSVVDFDFVIQHLTLPEIESWFKKHGQIDLVGKSFGVLKFVPSGFDPHRTCAIDLALPRTEKSLATSNGGYKDFTVQSDPNLPIEQDLARRDFTVNAMAYDIRLKTLIDPFHGTSDLENKIIRAVGNPSDRFYEDFTRILRGLRFASELHFSIDWETLDAIMHYAPSLVKTKEIDGLTVPVVARELVGEELIKGIRSDAVHLIRLLEETRALSILFPTVEEHLAKDSTYLAPIFALKPHQSELAIILLLRDETEQEIQQTFERTGLQTIPTKWRTHADQDEVVWIVKKLQESIRAEDIQFMRASQFEKWFMGRRGMLLTDALSLLQKTDVVSLIQKRKAEICARWVCEDTEPIPPLLTGEDILASGVPSGPRVRDILELIRDQQLDGKLLTREAALTWLKAQPI